MSLDIDDIKEEIILQTKKQKQRVGMLRSLFRTLATNTTIRARQPTAAALVIGDEILNGKTLDTNTHFLAKVLCRRSNIYQRKETIFIFLILMFCFVRNFGKAASA